MNNTLERHKAFPYVAWAVVIGFAFFVYDMSVNVNAEIGALEERTAALEAKLQ